ncbi:hypothetical protein PN441_07915 [Spirulina major CS-329]|uniref:hypothetical protein n=1 Tax=Spirulina TaxID=1154 RepID=UPI0023303997|nr:MULTISPECIES: hypothetical protein [Spirulina]MDB9495214.1 hypothetical protein [Spirulina subsalsa CS-330]MDB9502996.1 hypothetical protein [Spirulina major CS-329]
MSDSNQTFDLTTKEGRENALAVVLMVSPVSAAVWLGKTLFDGIATLTSAANEKEMEEQRKVAIDIIKAGKENGADEIEITMSQKAGIGLGSDFDGVPIEFIAVASGTMKLKVKYK